MTISTMEQEQHLIHISTKVTKSDKMSWDRKYRNMQKLVDKLTPIETQLLDLNEKRRVLGDQVETLRQVMVHECIHPANQLVHNEDHIVCKFCNRKLSIPKV
jgi:uncharacterized coiled-coil protein SlyX